MKNAEECFPLQNFILLRKTPRPTGKAGRYEYSLADGFWFALPDLSFFDSLGPAFIGGWSFFHHLQQVSFLSATTLQKSTSGLMTERSICVNILPSGSDKTPDAKKSGTGQTSWNSAPFLKGQAHTAAKLSLVQVIKKRLMIGHEQALSRALFSLWTMEPF